MQDALSAETGGEAKSSLLGQSGNQRVLVTALCGAARKPDFAMGAGVRRTDQFCDSRHSLWRKQSKPHGVTNPRRLPQLCSQRWRLRRRLGGEGGSC
jgi:hypothetical protein